MTKVAYYEDAELDKIIKRGNERSRYGQRNTKVGASPFERKRELKPREPLTREVAGLLSVLEFQKFHAMVDPEEWHRLDEVKSLAEEQIKDCQTGNKISFQKVGRKQVEPLNELMDHEPMYPSISKTQQALQEGFSPFLMLLTDVQVETLRCRYYQGLSQSDAGKYLGVSKKSVEVNEGRARVALRKHLLGAYPDRTEEEINGVG